MNKKYLLFLEYNCGLVGEAAKIGPEDEWIVYEGSEKPSVGDKGLGRICHQYLYWQSCENEPCESGGIVKKVEEFSEVRAKELGLGNIIEISNSFVDGRVFGVR